MIELAKQLALHFHRNQKYGEHPYSTHLNDVVENAYMQHHANEDAQIVAWLHDIVEDTEMTIPTLRAIGFDENVLLAIDKITKRKHETREDYINRVKSNRLATIVKICDSQANAVRCLMDADFNRFAYYKKASEDLAEYLNCDHAEWGYEGPRPRPECDCKGWGCFGCCDNDGEIRAKQGTFG